MAVKAVEKVAEAKVEAMAVVVRAAVVRVVAAEEWTYQRHSSPWVAPMRAAAVDIVASVPWQPADAPLATSSVQGSPFLRPQPTRSRRGPWTLP